VTRTPASGTATGTRCFLALLPDPASREQLLRCHGELERAISGASRCIRWIEPDARHLSLRFLGNADGAQIEYFKHMLPTLAPALPAFAASRYGVWPNRARPRLLVMELKADLVLSGLAQTCEEHARKAGFEPESRDFRAHVTLARLRPGCAFGIMPQPASSITFEAVALMQSNLVKPVASYRQLARVELPDISHERRA
jgi:RNA 2',3'-cyclic 3'-phosphodiesterase